MERSYNSVTSSRTMSAKAASQLWGSATGKRTRTRFSRTDVVVKPEERAAEFWHSRVSAGEQAASTCEREQRTPVALHDHPYSGSDALVDELCWSWSAKVRRAADGVGSSPSGCTRDAIFVDRAFGSGRERLGRRVWLFVKLPVLVCLKVDVAVLQTRSPSTTLTELSANRGAAAWLGPVSLAYS